MKRRSIFTTREPTPNAPSAVSHRHPIPHNGLLIKRKPQDEDNARPSEDGFYRIISSSKAKSSSIPVHPRGALRRTPSELQLIDDEALAKHREHVLFARIVDGISHKQQSNDYWIRQQNNMILRRIIQTQQQEEESSRERSTKHKEDAIKNHHLPTNLRQPIGMTLRDMLMTHTPVWDVATYSVEEVLDQEESKEDGIFVMDEDF